MDNKELFDLRMSEMMRLQKELQAAHPEWGGLNPQQGLRQLLWMVGEIGEVIDVVKKADRAEYMNGTDLRDHFVEEFCDVMMYLVDTMLCYGIDPAEFAHAYRKKAAYNLKRDYEGANQKKYGPKKG